MENKIGFYQEVEIIFGCKNKNMQVKKEESWG